MMKILSRGIAAIAAACLVQIAQADTVPLANSLDVQKRSCRNIDTVTLPLRSTGGDIVSIYANGYSMNSSAKGDFAENNVSVKLALKNDIKSQLQAYMSCETPFMKADQSMLNAVADITEKTSGTEMIGLFQYGWSNGESSIVTRNSVKTPADLSGARIVVQEHGPHIGYLSRVLADAAQSVAQSGGVWKAPDIIYTKNLIGFENDTPSQVFSSDQSVDAAVVLTLDANLLTSGNVGTGAEGSVKGAYTLLSTKSANRLISDVLVVRRDWFDAHPEKAKAIVSSLFQAEEKLREDVVKQIVEWDVVASVLVGGDDQLAIEDAKNLWRNYETVGLKGNVEWSGNKHPRSWLKLNDEIQSGMVASGALKAAHTLSLPSWDYQSLFGENIFDERMAQLPSFDQTLTAKSVEEIRESGDIDASTIIKFDINFEPNQQGFPVEKYSDKFQEVIEMSAVYGGAILTVEGHSDPTRYLKLKARFKKSNSSNKPVSINTLRNIRRSADNLSYRRAVAVRESIVAFAEDNGIHLDVSQFSINGLGITDPQTGMCGNDPCPPRTRQEWESNMRVTFRLINLESEEDVFTPPNEW